ncbi:three component ABC system middle component [Chryseobacterium sp. MEBOG07]|uniref:three component ABC system middle component n=1 Tax=Chryseobacterium sp. MEBOG07 TaxID=2879939 RepID=UPI001F3B8111|nr:three component ABC system middle component [Chryseobacterium sp. MEBOG07]UKB77365.1 DUF6521 family protein [Chryseobacterium sp. MEBOG07]
MNLPKWENRPEVTAHLVNPAFCSEIIRECIKAYKNEKNKNLPFSLSVLILPIVLTSKIRERLPKTKATTLHSWINGNEDLKIGFALHVNSYLPFSREAIMFGIAHDSLSIDEDGNIDIRVRRKKLKQNNDEVKSCITKAALLGKLFSKSGTPITIYSMFGIKP